ncbi:hypothetical protein T03_11829 [Trichinella britovi]|uniref:Integrase zinc-binding domain-containing protein n=1 Tax=Trichinella britovi TaxID=45882 RepID=A0A0V0YXC9_TRIBR|nr:hypothetical protein T03_11829 [Trichinella britovi]
MTKHPLILPDKHPLTRAIIRRCHLRQLHSGIETTLTVLRQRFWILRGRRNTGWLETICLENGTATSRSDSTNSTI